jgi:hypothetical protein
MSVSIVTGRLGGVRACLAAFLLGALVWQSAAYGQEPRVMERITPAFKNGGEGRSGVILDNDHVTLRSSASFFPNDPFFSGAGRYLAARGSDGRWTLQPGFITSKTFVVDVNDDFTQDIVGQNCDGNAFAPCAKVGANDTDVSGDVFARTPSGIRQVSTGSIGGNADVNAFYEGQSSDGKHILFSTTEPLEPGHTGGTQLYERIGSQVRLVGVLPDGTIDPGGAILGDARTGSRSPSASSDLISADGRVIFFESPNPDVDGDGVVDTNHQLYARIDGSETVHVSASQCSPACGPSMPATFWGASDDGNRVYFTTSGRLVPEDGDDTPDLYQFQLEGHKLTLVTKNCIAGEGVTVDCGWQTDFTTQSGRDGFGVIGVSQDGRRIYFGAPPTPSGDYGEVPDASLWLYDEAVGEVHFVAPVGGFASEVIFNNGNGGVGAEAPLAARMSTDGRVLVWESSLKLSEFDNAGLLQVYRYRAGTRLVDCISCTPNSVASGDNVEQSNRLSLSTVPDSLSRVAVAQSPNPLVSDDGARVAFQTWQGLVPTDANDEVDVYLWEDGRLTLLTDGQTDAPSTIMGITPDGRDVFFTTYSRLVPSDLDLQADLYDARVGGTAEPLSNAPAPCQGDQCQPMAPPPSVGGGLPASVQTESRGNVQSKRQVTKKSKRRAAKTCRRGQVRKRGKGGKVRCVPKKSAGKKQTRIR